MSRYGPAYSIKIGGLPLPGWILRRLQSWKYEDVEHVDKLVLAFDNLDGELTDRPEFELGAAVEFRHGYTGELSDPRFFTVTKPKGWKDLTVTCFGVTQLFNSARRIRKWVDATLRQVVGDIASDYDLEIETEERKDDNGNVLEFTYLQPNVGDLSFLVTLGYKIGYALWVEGGVLHFLPRKYGLKPSMEFVYLGLAGQVLDFVPEAQAINKKGKFKTGGVDLEEKEQFLVTQDGKTTRAVFLGKKFFNAEEIERNWDEAKQGTWVESPSGTKAEAEDLLQGKYVQEMDDQIRASMPVIGEPRLQARRTIIVSNVQKYSGLYYVERVIHSGDGSGYVSVATLTRNATYDSGAKYDRAHLDTVINENRETAEEFLTRTKDDPRYNTYRRLLKVG